MKSRRIATIMIKIVQLWLLKISRCLFSLLIFLQTYDTIASFFFLSLFYYLQMTQPEEEHAEEIMSAQPADIFTPSSPSNLTEWLIYFIYQIRSKPKYRPSGYWRYVIGVYKNLFLSFYFNWFAIVTSPLSSLAFLISYPIISSILLAFELGLKLFMDGLGGSHLVKLVSRDYGSGE